MPSGRCRDRSQRHQGAQSLAAVALGPQEDKTANDASGPPGCVQAASEAEIRGCFMSFSSQENDL